jgi:hypothetical protein
MKMPSQPGASSPSTAQDKAGEILDGYLDAMKKGVEKDSRLNAGYNTFLGIIKRSPESEVIKVLDAMEKSAPASEKSEKFAALEALEQRGSSAVIAADREKPLVLGQLKYLGFETGKAAQTVPGLAQTIDQIIESKECAECSPTVIRSLREAASMGVDKKRDSNPKPMKIEVNVQPMTSESARKIPRPEGFTAPSMPTNIRKPNPSDYDQI